MQLLHFASPKQWGRLTRVATRRTWSRTKKTLSAISTWIERQRALLWVRLYLIRFRLLVWKSRTGALLAAFVLCIGALTSAFFIPALQGFLDPYFAASGRLEDVRTFLVTVGSALIGAVAIVSAFAVFATQVNVERMPYGLFRRVSSDPRLLGSFAGALFIALGIAGLSLIPNRDWVGVAAFVTCWGIIFILALLLYSYQRALGLISPSSQLARIVATAARDLRIWVKRARRAAPLLRQQEAPALRRRAELRHDMERATYFQTNPHWTNEAKKCVRYAVSFARRYAEQGDTEVASASFDAVLAINAAYVAAKGRTFFTYVFMFEHPFTSDAFINDTLEHLRQSARIGISRGDENEIELSLRALAALVRIYSQIDYSVEDASKTHAHLAAAYLVGAVEAVLPHNMPDVLMEGMRLTGLSADTLLAVEGPRALSTLTEKLGTISCVGVAKEDYRSVTSAGVEQLARLSLRLLAVRTHAHDVAFAARDIRNSVALITRVFLTLRDNVPFSNVVRTYLAPYYSSTSPTALSAQLTGLVNGVIAAAPDDPDARQVVENFTQWADSIYQTEKEIYLACIESQSAFVFDIIHWIKHLTNLLLALARAPCCPPRARDELHRHAIWLISALSFVPDEESAVAFVERNNMTDTLFEAAADAYRYDAPDVGRRISELLLMWAFKAGPYRTGWSTTERAICGLAALALFSGDEEAIPTLRREIARRLAAGQLPDQGMCDDLARDIRGRAATLYNLRYRGSSIEQAMAQSDHALLEPLLVELADLISPDTAGLGTDGS